MTEATSKIQELYQLMASITAPICSGKNKASSCRIPHSCCSKDYCELATVWTKKRWKTTLKIPNRKIPFLNPISGCELEPHLRPLCTFHICNINSIGTTGNTALDNKYFKLRDQISKLEANYV